MKKLLLFLLITATATLNISAMNVLDHLAKVSATNTCKNNAELLEIIKNLKSNNGKNPKIVMALQSYAVTKNTNNTFLSTVDAPIKFDKKSSLINLKDRIQMSLKAYAPTSRVLKTFLIRNLDLLLSLLISNSADKALTTVFSSYFTKSGRIPALKTLQEKFIIDQLSPTILIEKLHFKELNELETFKNIHQTSMLNNNFLLTSITSFINAYSEKDLSLSEKLENGITIEKIINLSIIYLLSKNESSNFILYLSKKLGSSLLAIAFFHIMLKEVPTLFQNEYTANEINRLIDTLLKKVQGSKTTISTKIESLKDSVKIMMLLGEIA